MIRPPQHLSASEAASRFGVSAKALRLYEQRGLIAPLRSDAGWRTYGPDEMSRAAEIASLRALGLSLAQVASVLNGDAGSLAPALAAHQAALDKQLRSVAASIEQVRRLRDDLARGGTLSSADLARLGSTSAISFDLPWPWGGERFDLGLVRPLTWITGPLGCGKTRLAMRLAEAMPGARFLPLDRASNPDTVQPRVDAALAWLAEEGASMSEALVTLLSWTETDAVLVIDMVEDGLDESAQEALATFLRRRVHAPPLLLMTRSSAMLDLSAVGANEALILCPANHAPPKHVAPYPGAVGYESVASCLAPPEVRARTAGFVAMREPAA